MSEMGLPLMTTNLNSPSAQPLMGKPVVQVVSNPTSTLLTTNDFNINIGIGYEQENNDVSHLMLGKPSLMAEPEKSFSEIVMDFMAGESKRAFDQQVEGTMSKLNTKQQKLSGLAVMWDELCDCKPKGSKCPKDMISKSDMEAIAKLKNPEECGLSPDLVAISRALLADPKFLDELDNKAGIGGKDKIYASCDLRAAIETHKFEHCHDLERAANIWDGADSLTMADLIKISNGFVADPSHYTTKDMALVDYFVKTDEGKALFEEELTANSGGVLKKRDLHNFQKYTLLPSIQAAEAGQPMIKNLPSNADVNQYTM